jgi:ABC-type transport system involved in cytochrome c biogenesis permease component
LFFLEAMTFLPIVDRELRVASRQSGTHWIRLSAALVGLVIGGWVLLASHRQSPRILGTILFVTLSIFSYVYCILVGLRTTADCLSQEKREGTLGLLFLTDLKGYDVVLGKLAATSLNALYGLLAVVPIMAIPLLLGGVTAAEFWRVVLCALNGLFFSLAVGMFVSAISTDERRAMFATLVILLFFVAGLPLLGAVYAAWLEHDTPRAVFFLPSPGYAAFAAFDETYQMLTREKFNFFWASVACVHLMGWGFLGLACRIAPRSWRDRAESVHQARRRERWQQIKHGAGENRKRRRRHMLALNPVYWLTGRDRVKFALVYVVLAVVAVLWLWGLAEWRDDWLTEPVYIMTALAVHSILKLWIASEASRQFAQDKRSGALELLVSTPLRVREIIHGQVSSLFRQFFVPVLLVLGVDFLFLMEGQRGNNWDWTLVCLAGMSILVADMVALAWLGMWRGLSTGQVSRATASTVFCIMALPWIVYGGVMTLLATSNILREFSRLFTTHEELSMVVLWTGIGLVMDLAFALAARHWLLTRFRTVIPQRAKRRFQMLSFLTRDLPADR